MKRTNENCDISPSIAFVGVSPVSVYPWRCCLTWIINLLLAQMYEPVRPTCSLDKNCCHASLAVQSLFIRIRSGVATFIITEMNRNCSYLVLTRPINIVYFFCAFLYSMPLEKYRPKSSLYSATSRAPGPSNTNKSPVTG